MKATTNSYYIYIDPRDDVSTRRPLFWTSEGVWSSRFEDAQIFASAVEADETRANRVKHPWARRARVTTRKEA
jgi:hypothetical protein